MALATYSDLKNSLAEWMHRANLTAVIPDCITLCESDFNRRLRIDQMEVRASASFNEGYEDLPTDFLELREIKVNASPTKSLHYMTPQQMTEFYPTLESGTPEYYTIVGTSLRVNKLPSDQEVEIAYYVKIPSLSDVQTTNWMLTTHPDIYLYGSLYQAELFTKNDRRVSTFLPLYEKALALVSEQDKKARWSGSTLQMRVSWQ